MCSLLIVANESSWDEKRPRDRRIWRSKQSLDTCPPLREKLNESPRNWRPVGLWKAQVERSWPGIGHISRYGNACHATSHTSALAWLHAVHKALASGGASQTISPSAASRKSRLRLRLAGRLQCEARAAQIIARTRAGGERPIRFTDSLAACAGHVAPRGSRVTTDSLNANEISGAVWRRPFLNSTSRLAKSFTMDAHTPVEQRRHINLTSYRCRAPIPSANLSCSSTRVYTGVYAALSISISALASLLCSTPFSRLLAYTAISEPCLSLTLDSPSRIFPLPVHSFSLLSSPLDTATLESSPTRLVSASLTPISSCVKKRQGES